MQKNTKMILIPLLFLLSACSSSMPKFDQVAYEKTVSLKVDSLALMDKSTEAYGTHKKEIESLTIRVEKAYEYAKGKPNNRIITKQWRILKDTKGNQIGGYLKRWRDKEKLSKVFTVEAKRLISEGFDQVIGLESGLIKAKK